LNYRWHLYILIKNEFVYESIARTKGQASVISVFDKYVLKLLSVSTFVTALSLTLIILLTQSIRFLELVISSDASIVYFLVMMGLAIPKFLEAILPLAFAIGTIYTTHKMVQDRESIIMTAAGASITTLGRGFFIFAFVMMIVQFVMSAWVSPLAVEQLQKTRGDVQSHYATLMFREGVFNNISKGLTAFVETRRGNNELLNLMIHDTRGSLNEGKDTTIIAKRGIVNITDDKQQLLVYNGTQYQADQNSGNISRLDFSQYTLDIPTQKNTVGVRWKEPDERTFEKLFISKETGHPRDISKNDEFVAEIHKRITTPFLYLGFTIMVIYFMFMCQWNRRNHTKPLIQSGILIIAVQATHIVMYNEARDLSIMNIALYIVPTITIAYGIFQLYKYQRA
jgi:lipopolysaccharide export system permease protein